MISTNDFHTGLTIELDGEVYTVVDFQHVKPGKGSAFVRSRLKNVKTGYVIERTFRAGEKLPRAHIDYREMQYLYSSGDENYFMDTSTYEQLVLNNETLGDAKKYLKENMIIGVQMYEGSPIGVELPNFVELAVVDTDPGLRGDTATGGSKPATLETGAVVQVPLFVNVGDIIRVDTRTGQYLERV
ncbi:MAG TPA: elongation factor P [Firmicutes bacterium]|mgnify:CR=1 FL=1|nr:elongation factor P [Bacillota bacterium]